MRAKPLGITNTNAAMSLIPDLEIVGNPDMFTLLCKASSKDQKWSKSTKALELTNGCLVQVSTQIEGNVAEALCFIPQVKIEQDINNGYKLVKSNCCIV